MNFSLLPDVTTAMRLTRRGRLLQATATIQHALRSSAAKGPAERYVATRSADASELQNGLTAEVTTLPNPAPVSTAAPKKSGIFIEQSYANDAGRRDYKLYIPRSSSGEPQPLIVMLHGCKQSVDDFAAGTRMNMAAEEHGCLVAYPAQSISANPSRCWNWFDRRDQERERGEPSLIVGIVREIADRYPVDRRRVYIAGLSAGGAAAAVLGTLYPDMFAAVGIHSGLACGAAHDLPSAFAAMHGASADVRPAERLRSRIPTIVFHGDSDATVHPANGDRIVASTAASSLQVMIERGRVPGGRSFTQTTYANTAGKTVMEFWLVHGAGHAWSGGSVSGSYTDPSGPDATREMMRFFLSQRR